MKHAQRLIALATLLAAPVSAQFAPPQPHELLKKFDTALGQWEGKGKFYGPLSSAGMPWTSTSRVERVLDGFAVRETLDVDMGAVGRYLMVAIYAYDANRKTLIVNKVDNYAGASEGLCQWVGGSLVTAQAALFGEQGTPLMLGAERSKWTFTGDESTLASTMCAGDLDPYLHIEGAMKRTSAEAKPTETDLHTTKLMKFMQPLAPLLGEWKIEGAVQTAPGAEAMKIKGVDRIWALHGGRALVAEAMAHPAADDIPFRYQAIGLIGWNPGRECWDHYTISNTGDVLHGEWHPAGEGKLITVHSGRYMGQPFAERGVLEFGEDGPQRVWSDRYSGVEAGYRAFEATYATEPR